jgi:hypothetical protein
MRNNFSLLTVHFQLECDLVRPLNGAFMALSSPLFASVVKAPDRAFAGAG